MGRYALPLKAFLVGVIAACLLTFNVEAQGPFSAQIQQFYQFLMTAPQHPTGTWTFQNVVINGTCTGSGCGGGGGAFSAITSGTNTTAAMVVGTGASLGVSGSGTITATAVPVGGVSGLGTGVGTWLATPSSANLLSALTTKTGTGTAVFDTSPKLTTPTIATSETLTRNALGTSPADGYVIQNTTAAAAGAQQYSPYLRLTGQGWKTNATAASQQVDFSQYVVPVQGAANPSAELRTAYRVNGGSYADILKIDSTGTLYGAQGTIGALQTVLTGGAQGWSGGGVGWILRAGNNFGSFAKFDLSLSDGNRIMGGDSTGIYVNGFVGLGTGLTNPDIAIGRSSAGLAEINSGTIGTFRDLQVRHQFAAGTSPTVSNTSANSCGTTAATLAGKDEAGAVTVGATAGTSCTVTFGTAYTNAPACHANNDTGGTPLNVVTTTTTAVISGTFAASDKLKFSCKSF